MDDRVDTLALVAGGGVVGAVCRYAVGLVVGAGTLPWGTLLANVLGSFLLGVLLYERRLRDAVPDRVRLVAGTGFLSSFTTYSTFAFETSQLPPGRAVAYVAATYGFGFLAVLVGRRVAGWVA
jgi:CrcB protein